MKPIAFRGNTIECTEILFNKGYVHKPRTGDDKVLDEKECLFLTYYNSKQYSVLPYFPKYEDLDNAFRGRKLCYNIEEFKQNLGKWVGSKLLILKK